MNGFQSLDIQLEEACEKDSQENGGTQPLLDAAAPAPPSKQNVTKRASSEDLDDYLGFPEDSVIKKGKVEHHEADVVSRIKLKKRKAPEQTRFKLDHYQDAPGVIVEAGSLLADDFEPIQDKSPRKLRKLNPPAPVQPAKPDNDDQTQIEDKPLVGVVEFSKESVLKSPLPKQDDDATTQAAVDPPQHRVLKLFYEPDDDEIEDSSTEEGNAKVT